MAVMNQSDKHHVLENEYTIWFNWKNKNTEFKMAKIGNFNSVEGFWNLYSWMKRPHDLKPCDIYVFKSGIQPYWEDEGNKNGGKNS